MARVDIDEAALITRYKAGDSINKLAVDFNIARQTIYSVLKKNNVGKHADTITLSVTKLLEACRAGVPLAVAAKRLGISESTATRALRKHRQEVGTLDIVRGRPTTSRLKTVSRDVPRDYLLTEVDADLGVAFPYPAMLSTEVITSHFERLKSFVGRLDDVTIRPMSRVGLPICGPFFPNRYHARSRFQKSAYEAWNTPGSLKSAIRFQIGYEHPTTPPRVLRALMVKCRTPTIFRPAVTKFICDRYCPKEGRVWDPCSGYGGRLLGAAAAGMHYTGTDIEPETVDGNRKLAIAIGADADVILQSATTFNPPPVDLVFTSPPYFDRERYSAAGDVSWEKRITVDEWFNVFTRPIFERAQVALSTRGHLVINIADLREQGETLPLVSKTIETALAVGFEHTETLLMPLAAINRIDPTEPILVFRKL